MYSWYLVLYVAYIILLMVFGTVIGLKIFLKNSYGECRVRVWGCCKAYARWLAAWPRCFA